MDAITNEYWLVNDETVENDNPHIIDSVNDDMDDSYPATDEVDDINQLYYVHDVGHVSIDEIYFRNRMFDGDY